MRSFVLGVALSGALFSNVASADPTTPVHKKRRAKAAHATPATPTPLVKSEATPPGAQLGPNRTIEAPQAPGPDSSPPREVVRAKDVQPTKDSKQHDIQPPYPTGYDPGRNMQAPTGYSPTSQSPVP